MILILLKYQEVLLTLFAICERILICKYSLWLHVTLSSHIRTVTIATKRARTWVSRLVLIWIIVHPSRLVTRRCLTWVVIDYRSSIWCMWWMTWWRLWHYLSSSWHWRCRSWFTPPMIPSIWIYSFLWCRSSSLFIWWSLLIVNTIWICTTIPVFEYFMAFPCPCLRFRCFNILLLLCLQFCLFILILLILILCSFGRFFSRQQ